jgi:Lrp/AsnC family transcriptional regulator, leucine-responsive regulatory protein
MKFLSLSMRRADKPPIISGKNTMTDHLQKIGFDELDRAILEELQLNGRISVADLARKIFLSQPAVHNRIKRLERAGVIEQYVALLNHEIVGYDLMCFVQISIQPHTNEQITRVEDIITDLPEVQECYRLTGEYHLLLKVVVRNSKALDRFIADKLTVIEGMDRVQSSVVMKVLKSETALSLK